jgi:disulfide bond formation protein DsbB
MRTETFDRPVQLLYAAWVLALAASLAVLFIGEVMGQAPCVLCWYQRIAMFPLAVLLGIAAFRGDAGVAVYTLPVAVIGAAIAGFHSLLYFGALPETLIPCGVGPSCTSSDMTLFNLPLPALSLGAFLAIIAALAASRRSAK